MLSYVRTKRRISAKNTVFCRLFRKLVDYGSYCLVVAELHRALIHKRSGLGSIGRRASTGTPSSFATSSILLSPNILYFFCSRGTQNSSYFRRVRLSEHSSFCHIVCLFTIMVTRSCGVVTIIIPSTGRLWNTVSGTSPVPGGISTNI